MHLLLNLFEKLENDSIVLTPNRRLSNYIIDGYSSFKIKQNTKTWERPKVYSKALFMSKIYNEIEGFLDDRYQLISSDQELLIFENILKKIESVELIRMQATATLLREAWHLKCQYDVPITGSNVDEELLLKVCEEYTNYCKDNHLVDTSKQMLLIKHMFDNVSKNQAECNANLDVIEYVKMFFPKKIFLIAFDEITPLFQQILDKINELGVEITRQNIVVNNPLTYQITHLNFEDELYNIAVDAKHKYEIDKNVLIGIVIPNLQEQRKVVAKIVREVFNKIPVNISAPDSLSSYQMIDTALLILELAQKKIDVEIISLVLRTPYILSMDNIDIRSQFDVLLRKLKVKKVTWQQFLDVLELDSEIHNKFSNFYHLLTTLPKLTTSKVWVEYFIKMLNILEWPGNKNHSFTNAQMHTQFKACISLYQKYENILGEHNYFEALKRFRKIVSDMPFLPEAKDCPIQVLGILEATGIPFDYTYVLGLNSKNWPSEPNPNPFIDIKTQRKYNLPRSSPARELEIAKRFANTLSTVTKKQVVFSCHTIVDNNEVYPSSLILDLPVYKDYAIDEEVEKKQKSLQCQEQYQEKYTDNKLPELDITGLAGGTSIIMHQSLCPFSAAVKYRFNAEDFEKTTPGITNQEKGILIHEILDVFWKRTKNQENLISITTEKLVGMLKVDFNNAILKLKKHSINIRNVPNKLIELEEQRVLGLLLQVFEIEKQRERFKVLYHEKSITANLNNLKIKMRVDRVDELEDGGLVVIDYKTGNANVSDWLGERPTLPQVPIYCISMGKKPIASLFLIIRSGNVKFEGLVARENIVPGVKTFEQLKLNNLKIDFNEQITSWAKDINKIAFDFSKGVSDVSPLKNDNTCNICKMHTVCRIKEVLN